MKARECAGVESYAPTTRVTEIVLHELNAASLVRHKQPEHHSDSTRGVGPTHQLTPLLYQ